MTEPMTARERAQELAYAYRDLLGEQVPVDVLMASLEASILDALAAERAHLAQIGDVEGLSRELYEVVHEGLQVDLKDAWERENPRVINAMGRLARHVQVRLAAVAEAARIEARDAIAALLANGEPDPSASDYWARRIRALRPVELEKKT